MRVSKSLRAAAKTATAAAALSALALAQPAAAAVAKSPIRIGVIAPFSAIDGASIVNAAKMATGEINAAGGIDGRPIKLYTYDDHASASDGVRAFQRAAKQDHVSAVLGVFISEVALAVEPWSARLHMPFIITGAASDQLLRRVHQDYARYKYTFMNNLNSVFLADSVCDASHDILVKDFGYKTAAVMSEDAAWTQPLDNEYLKCLPKAGLKVLDHVRFNPDTTDFTPIFNKIEAFHPDAIVTGIAHVGVKPTVQWHDERVPALLAGWSSQAGASTFWNATNGATEGVITGNLGAPGAALTPKSNAFSDAYTKEFKTTPAYNSYTTYDAFYILKDAIERAHSTKPDALVAALEKTDHVGTIGREEYFGRGSIYAHGLKYGKEYVPGVALQWQNGKQVTIWPEHAANGKPILPAFVKQASK
ncbi:MAG: ABC transporter substrate-binding protein [Betaproteobacteria bacterium]|nr:ABC transporter substrate-binding protein [Betaproteobacteria bacterium]